MNYHFRKTDELQAQSMLFYIQYQDLDDSYLRRHAGLSKPFWASAAAEKDGGMTNARLG
jgi:hypothetical protein